MEEFSKKEIEVPQSNILMPVRISRIALNNATQEVVNQIFEDPLPLEAGFTCAIRCNFVPEVQIKHRSIFLKIPLDLNISSGSRFNPLKANGSLELLLKTDFDILDNKLLSKTELTEYYWLKTPTISIGGFPLKAEFLANQLIKSYKNLLTKTIDKEIGRAFNVQKIRAELMRYFSKPFFTSEDGELKVFVSPRIISLAPLEMNRSHLIIPVVMQFENILSSQAPIQRLHHIQLAFTDVKPAESTFSLQARLPMAYISKQIQENIENQEFKSANSSLKVTNLSLSGQGKGMNVTFQTLGSFQGQFFMGFEPNFNSEKQKIVLDNFELKLLKGRGLSKTLFNLIKQRVSNAIKMKLEQELNAFAEGYLQEGRLLLSNKEMIDGLYLNGQILKYDVTDFWIQQGRMYFNFHVWVQTEALMDHIDTSKIMVK